jgi:hypothetical protein
LQAGKGSKLSGKISFFTAVLIVTIFMSAAPGIIIQIITVRITAT